MPSMFDLVGRCESVRFWCPVGLSTSTCRDHRAGTTPEDTSLQWRPSPKITTTKGHITFWFRNCYSGLRGGKKGGGNPRVNAHKVRAMSHSLAAYQALHSRLAWTAAGGVATNPFSSSICRNWISRMTGGQCSSGLYSEIQQGSVLVHIYLVI